MKGFKGLQQITGPKGNKPGGGNNPFAAKPGGGGGGGKKNNNNNNNKNKGNKGNKTASSSWTSYPGGGTNLTDANRPGAIATLADEKPLDYFSGVMAGQGQLNAGGPNTYQNWLQNQFFNDLYGRYMTQLGADPLSNISFDKYLTNTYGANLAGAAQRQFNLLTPSQRGEFNNVYNNATGRMQFWG